MDPAENGAAPPAPDVTYGTVFRSSPAPFRWSGRPWKGPVAGLAVILVLLFATYLLRDTSDTHLQSAVAPLAWFAILSLVVLVPATVLGTRRMTYEVDDEGVLVRHPGPKFDVRWGQLSRIETAKPPIPSGVPFLLVGNVTLYGFRTREGFIAGFVVPSGELRGRGADAFVSSLLQNAKGHSVPVVEVPWQEARGWRKQRLRA